MPRAFYSFTTEYGGIARALITEARVSKAFDPRTTKKGDEPSFLGYQAIWDTGATGTVITQKVVDDLKLAPIGRENVHTAGGSRNVPAYMVNLILPNKVHFFLRRAILAPIAGNVDILIGMDIICHGDFAITNTRKRSRKNTTVFSFRIPSVRKIDFNKLKRN
jgi:hypothetical protein